MGAAAEDVIERDWLLRGYDPNTDESALMYLLGVGYARSKSGWRSGASGAGESRDGNTPDHDAVSKQKAFLDAHAPVWRWLLKHADVTLAVDPLAHDSIWGWIVTSEPNVVHSLGVKRSTIKAGLAKDLVVDLAGDRWRSYQVVTLELPQLRSSASSYKSSHLIGMDRPYQWSLDPTWIVTRMVSR